MDCCLLSDTDANGIATKKHDVVSGPKFCASEKATPSNNYFRDVFSGKTIKCENVLLSLFFISKPFDLKSIDILILNLVTIPQR